MRILVISGFLTCALFFGILSNNASAETFELALLNDNEPTAVNILTAINNESINVKNIIELINKPVEVKHTIKENETLSKIAKDYKTTWKRIYDKNTKLEFPDIINPGDEIIIPQKDEVLDPRKLPVVHQPKPVIKKKASSNYRTTVLSSVSVPANNVSGNWYTSGNCTWYVKSRRPDLPNNLGNALTWAIRARAQGIATGSKPRVGAVGQRDNHVVYVESVNSDGTITISEMNYRSLYTITKRVVTASSFTYIY